MIGRGDYGVERIGPRPWRCVVAQETLREFGEYPMKTEIGEALMRGCRMVAMSFEKSSRLTAETQRAQRKHGEGLTQRTQRMHRGHGENHEARPFRVE